MTEGDANVTKLVGVGTTLMVMLLVAVHPVLVVPTTVYEEVTDGVTTMLAELDPPGLHV
jgi:hypothetical protein